jgi:hypothetical protein
MHMALGEENRGGHASYARGARGGESERPRQLCTWRSGMRFGAATPAMHVALGKGIRRGHASIARGVHASYARERVWDTNGAR